MFTMIGKKLIRKAVRIAGPDADAEPDHQNGHEGRLGQGVEGGHQRVDRGVGQARAADQEAQQHADDDGDAKAGHRDPEGAPGVAGNDGRGIRPNCSQMRAGLGKMNSETLKAEQIACHRCNHGRQQDQRRPAFELLVMFMAYSLGGSLVDDGARLAHGTDVAAQLVHDVGELGGVGHLQVARCAAGRSRFLTTKRPGLLLMHVDRVGQENRFAQVVGDQDDVEALGFPCRSRSVHHSSSRVKASSAPKGSSSSSILGS
jgi:hypothetical protein